MPRSTNERSPMRLQMGTICTIDDDGVLRKKRSVPVSALENYTPKSGEIVFRNPVDNLVDRYFWTGKTFLPLHDDPTQKLQSNPELLGFLMKIAEGVIAEGLLPNPPANAAQIIDWWKRSFDGSGR